MRRLLRCFALSAVILSVSACGGCGEDEPAGPGEACEPGAETPCVEGYGCLEKGDDFACLVPPGGDCDADADETYCGEGTVCESTADGGHACWTPVSVQGQVFDSESEDAIEGAHVIALDDESSAISDVAISAPDGSYSLVVPVTRDAEGRPVDDLITLRASAADYQSFPGGIRTALPIDLSAATREADDDGETRGWGVASALTDIALIALPDDQTGRPHISGQIVSETREAGVLVVAEAGGEGISAVSDFSGAFTIFNVPSGSYEVRGYAADVQLTPESVTVEAEHVVGVELVESDEALTTVTGSASIVNAGEGKQTSVVLVPVSTFDANFGRGEVPSGLRAPRNGAPDITGAWTIENVPAGDYIVLAAFENDLLVRDPDTTIGGTETLKITVPPAGGSIDAGSFKITGALPTVSPGAAGPEAVTSAPMLIWGDDSSEDYYSVQVFNAFGELVWEDGMVPRVSGGETVSIQYGGPLDSGMYYQFRALSLRDKQGGVTAISATEDLKGVFYVE